MQKSPSSLSEIRALNAKSRLMEMKAQSSDKLILGHLNVNSIRNKFEALKFIIDNNIDILLISETKLDDSFPSAQFLIKGFSAPYRFDRNSKGGGLLFYIREDIPSKILTYSSNCDIETLLVDINLRKRKWLWNGSCNPNKSQISHHFECLNSLLDEHSKKYENFFFIGDFNVNTSDSSMKEFCSLNGLKNLINEPTCYKNSEKPTCIDLILTNQPTLFQRSAVLETGLSDFHLLTVTVVPLFTNKASRGEKIILTEAEKHISDDKKICNIFNNFFSKVVSDLKIPDYYNYFSQENTCSLSTIIETFEKHPSILNIKKRKLVSVFSFRKTTQKKVLKVIQDLNAKKSCQTSDTPTKIIKLNCDIFSNLIYKHFNCCIDKGEFPNDLKHADIVLKYKKENCRPVSVLSNLSKIYEKLMYNQLYEYFDNILLPSQCGFRKGYSAQHCLLVMIEKFKEAIDRGYEFGALLTDLSKAFDCINHPLLIAKLYNYGVSPLSINLIFFYLNNRTHRTKINNCFAL